MDYQFPLTEISGLYTYSVESVSQFQKQSPSDLKTTYQPLNRHQKAHGFYSLGSF